MSAVFIAIIEIIQFGISEDHYETYPGLVRALHKNNITEIANKTIHPDNLVWLVVGDREKIEQGTRELNYSEFQPIDLDGNPVD